MLVMYFIANEYASPEWFVSGECFLVALIFSIGYYIIKGVEQIALVNKAKSEFVSIVSHQMRSPLSAIHWEVELILSKMKEGLNARQIEMIDKIGKSNDRMIRLVNDLLDVTRIEQGRFALYKESLDFVETVREIVEENNLTAKANSVKIHLSVPENPIIIQADRKRIKMVVDNLISNAIKYSLEGGEVGIDINKKEEKYILFSIKDSGIGIPSQQHKFIFQKFFRGNNVIRYRTEGTGLGLYIAKNVVEQSGGKIWFDSQESSGSIFYFKLPINN
jgi:signal transduction histidine kinase